MGGRLSKQVIPNSKRPSFNQMLSKKYTIGLEVGIMKMFP